ncbi:MAG: T9SS type A sorting domain-containing protein [bacterium]|nr:T9SS type A sorting domain-containing protein [bacterium]
MHRIPSCMFALSLLLASSATGAELIDFDTYPGGAAVPEGYTVFDQWRSLGVVFTMGDSVRAAYAVPHACSLSAPNHVGGDPAVLAWFVDPQTGLPAATDFVGTAQDECWGNGEGILMTAYDAQGQVVASEFNSGSGHLTTFSFPEPTVVMIRMYEFSQGIDDFTFNTPVPLNPVGVAAQPVAGLMISPNPVATFRGEMARIALQGTSVPEASLRIFDLRGRLVRVLPDLAAGTGDPVVEWNGCDDDGEAASPGVYFIRWTGGGRTLTEKLTLLR